MQYYFNIHAVFNWSDVIIIMIISIKTHMYILVSLSYVARNTVSKIHDEKKWPQWFENRNTIVLQLLNTWFSQQFHNKSQDVESWSTNKIFPTGKKLAQRQRQIDRLEIRQEIKNVCRLFKFHNMDFMSTVSWT